MGSEFQRQYFLDFCKMFVIFIMVWIHVYEELGDEKSLTAFGSYFTYVTGLFTGAPLFMICMGMTLNSSKSALNPALLFKRGVIILIGGYVLNLARTLAYFFIEDSDRDIYYELLNIDIFQFAGLALIAMSIFFYFKFKPLTILLIAIGFAVFSSVFSKLLPFIPASELTSLSEYVKASFYGLFWFSSDKISSFGFLIWFIFPAFGYWFGSMAKNSENKSLFYGKNLYISFVAMIVILVVAMQFNLSDMLISYQKYVEIGGLNVAVNFQYAENVLESLLACASIVLLLSLAYKLVDGRGERIGKSNKELGDNYAYKTAMFFSKNLSIIYVVQWVIIGNLGCIAGFKLTPQEVIVMFLAVLVASILISIFYGKVKIAMKNR